MAEWSKVLSLTASYLSPLLEFKYRPGHVRQLPVTIGVIGSGIRQVLI